MKRNLAILSALIMGLMGAQSAMAQAASAPTTRAEVKSDAKAAVKAGDVPKGEVGKTVAPMSSGGKEKRAMTKAEAKAAEKAGTIEKGPSPSVKPMSGEKSRAAVKADAKAAIKAGEVAKGEAGTGTTVKPAATK